MKFYVGVTDWRWFDFHRTRSPDEVNFWRPGGVQAFKAISPGAPFLFKLHAPINKIAGVGFFAHHSNLPLSLAWDALGEKNGASDQASFLAVIQELRRDSLSDPVIGCTVLSSPLFWDEKLWIDAPEDWGRSIVQGKTYDTEQPIGNTLWAAASDRLVSNRGPINDSVVAEPGERYGSKFITRARLGQGGFRIVVTDSYHRRCAMTGERTLPVLEAAHIQPYADNGPHAVRNGICLRSDLHILFDRGYLTISPDYRIEVSRRIREEFQNGRDYYALHGKALVIMPDREDERPAVEFIQWHNNRFVA